MMNCFPTVAFKINSRRCGEVLELMAADALRGRGLSHPDCLLIVYQCPDCFAHSVPVSGLFAHSVPVSGLFAHGVPVYPSPLPAPMRSGTRMAQNHPSRRLFAHSVPVYVSPHHYVNPDTRTAGPATRG